MRAAGCTKRALAQPTAGRPHPAPPPAATLPADLAKGVLQYEKGRFAAWSAGVEAAIAAGLRQPLLSRPPPGDSAAASSLAPAGGARVAINFPPALLRLMREAKYLDQLGLAVPQAAVNLALQEGQLRRVGHGRGQRCRLWCNQSQPGAWPGPAGCSATLISPLALQGALPRAGGHAGAPRCGRRAPAQHGARPAGGAAGGAGGRAGAGAHPPQLDLAHHPRVCCRSEQGEGGGGACAGAAGRPACRSATAPPAPVLLRPTHPAAAPPPAPQALDKFASLAAQVQKHTRMVEHVVHCISRARLVPPDVPAPAQPTGGSSNAGQPAPQQAAGQPGAVQAGAADVPELQAFFEDWEQHRQQVGCSVAGALPAHCQRLLRPLLPPTSPAPPAAQVVAGLVARYRSVGPLLGKVEELVAGSASGKSPRLAG